MKQSEYWRGRFEILEESQLMKGEAYYKTLEAEYKRSQARVQKEIEAWYGRFATNNQISMVEAKRLLNTRELAEFKWSVDDYIKYGQLNAIDGSWMKQLENASARVHVSRLEALQLQTQQQMEVLFGNQVDGIDKLARKIYSDGYYHTAYEIQNGMNIGWDLQSLNKEQLDLVLSKPWSTDMKTFRDRCWTQKADLVNTVQTQLTQGIIRGDAPDRAITAIQKQFGVSRNKAGRLVMTESAAFASIAQKDAFGELGVEQFEIVATLDLQTSELCQGLDGNVVDLADYDSGVTAPPFHPWCRTTTVPWFADDLSGERFARGADGKGYYVPETMNYKDWKADFVDGGAKVGLTPAPTSAIVKVKQSIPKIQMALSDFPAAFTEKKEAGNTQKLIDFVNGIDGADQDVVKLYTQIGKLDTLTPNSIPFSISHASGYSVNYRYRGNGALSEVKLTIPKLEGDDLAGQVTTTLHENMHLMDLYARKDVGSYRDWMSDTNVNLRDAFMDSGADMSPEISDLFKAFNEECNQIRSNAYIDKTAAFAKLRTEFEAKGGVSAGMTVYKQYQKEKAVIEKAYDASITYATRNALGGSVTSLQDIYDALSKGTYRDRGVVQFGHGSTYYKTINSRIEETVANYGALSVLRPDLIDLLRADKPELVKELEGFVKDMLKKAGV